MKILLSALLFLCQPILWMGLIRSYLDFRHRSQRARRQFNTAVYELAYEVRHFLAGLVVLGIIFSVVSWFLNVSVPLIWVISYEILTAVSLILIPGTIFPVTLVGLATLTVVIFNYVRWGTLDSSLNPNYLMLISLALLALGGFIVTFGGRFLVPRIFDNQRGNRIGGYPFKELTIIPFLVMVPGNDLHQFLSFYPTFNIDGHSMGVLFLPLLLGLRFTIFKRNPRRMFKRLGFQFLILGLIGGALSFLSYDFHWIVIFGLIGVVLLTWLLDLVLKHYDMKDSHWYSETLRGVRVMGIEPNTPAAKMNLHVGDIILTANGQSVSNEDQFYKALQIQPTYCRLRFQNRRGQFNITETAIFNDAPHDIGVVLFRG